MSVLYQLLMALADGAALALAAHGRRAPQRGGTRAVSAAAGALLLGLGLAAALGEGMFGAMRLAAYGIFLHAPVILGGIAALYWRAARRIALASAAVATALVAVAADAFLVEPHWLEVTRVEVRSSKAPRPLKIALIADLQTDDVGDYERAVLRRVMQEAPDLIAMAGDYIHEWDPARHAAQRSALRAAIVEAGLSAPLGVFAVRGNVEPPGWEEIFTGLPATVLGDRQRVSRDGVTITGLDLGASFDPRISIESAEGFHIVLGHAPDFAMGDVHADLLLAGHTHGGQVRLPGIGPLITLSRVPRSWAAGVTHLPGDRTLVVSRGIGMERGAAPRLRFLCRPELVFIDVRPE